ncbi:MAG: histidine phosphatase domain-containing protein [Hyperionvirus sp.]|uniref:Histidine phosphatase domain-containing protein n=1 Tax=Hyperionvirus sp. TaxID=2487770 RepID=A0A3G5ABM3_9VIRU|nr:MAG: histidine phosphatase domain-containing protein [Hyperionvirus sp.]
MAAVADIKTLEKIIIFSRHGARGPNKNLPKMPKWEVKDLNDPPLTETGKRMCFDFGKRITESYKNIDFKKSLILSTNFIRTRESAKYFSKGAFGEEFSAEGSEPTIEMKLYRSRSFDTKEWSIVKKSVTFEQIQKDLNIDLGELNEKISVIFGYDIKVPYDYFDVYSTLECYSKEGIEAPKEWTGNIALKSIVHYYFNKIYADVKVQKMFIDDVYELVEEIILNHGIEFAYLSSHDTILFPLVKNITGSTIEIADYCSHIRYEVWSDSIKIYHDDILLTTKKRI